MKTKDSFKTLAGLKFPMNTEIFKYLKQISMKINNPVRKILQVGQRCGWPKNSQC